MKKIKLNFLFFLLLIGSNLLWVVCVYMYKTKHKLIKFQSDVKIKQNNNKSLFTDFSKTNKEKSLPDIYACVMFRIWDKDEFAMSNADILDWIHYMRWSGVNHFLMYDNCHDLSECQTNLISEPGVVYQRWPDLNYANAQSSAITHCMSVVRQSDHDAWVISCDLDEYAFSPQDKMRGHLQRQILSQSNDTSQILIRTVFFGGQNMHKREINVPIMGYYTMKRAYAEDHYHRTKPLFRVSLTSSIQPNIVHEMLMTHGKTEIMNPSLLRLNHYWGNRLYETENELVRDTEILVALQDMYKKV